MKRPVLAVTAILIAGAILSGACSSGGDAPDPQAAQGGGSDARSDTPVTSLANPTTTRSREEGCQGVLGVQTADSPSTTNALGDVSPETNRTIPFSATWTGDHYLAVGQEKRGQDDHAITYTSKDGVSWQTGATGQAPGLGSGPMVTLGGRYFLVVGTSKISGTVGSAMSNLFTSTDGANWTAVPESGIQEQYPEDFVSIATNGRVLVGTDHSGHVFSSSDGRSWAKVLPKGNEDTNGAELTANANGFVVIQVVSSSGSSDGGWALWYSADGVNWEDAGAANANLVLSSSSSRTPSLKNAEATATQKQFVIAGTEVREGGNTNGVVWSSSDGRKWESTSEQTDLPFTGPGAQSIDAVVGGPDFVIVHASIPNSNGKGVFASRDLQKWAPISLPVDPTSSGVVTAASGDGVLLLDSYGDKAAFCR